GRGALRRRRHFIKTKKKKGFALGAQNGPTTHYPATSKSPRGRRGASFARTVGQIKRNEKRSMGKATPPGRRVRGPHYRLDIFCLHNIPRSPPPVSQDNAQNA